MADRIETRAVTVQPGAVLGSAIQSVSLARDGVMVKIEVVIPDGVYGTAGFALLYAHSQVIPYNKGGYVTGNDETLAWDVSNYPDGGSWQVDVFNNGTYPHTFYFRFLVNEVNRNVKPLASQVATSLLNPSTIEGS